MPLVYQSTHLLVIVTHMKDRWKNIDNTLYKKFTFQNFKEALLFVNKASEIFEECNHHPDICIKSYKEVHITTTTHDAGNTVTEKDYQITKAIDRLL